MQPILQHLFKKNTLQEVPVETLQQLTSDFPYFAIGQFLLTRKLQESENAGYGDQFQKTLVYFNNPLWLQYQLSEPATAVERVSDISENNETIVAPVEELLNDSTQTTHDLVEMVVLNQENDYRDTKIHTTTPAMPVETSADESVGSGKKNDAQTIQREAPFNFQAYYTVDYFASQGIKLGQDNQQHDKLGKQLKSFTEWLKTMRRLPETSVADVLDKINDGEIARIAAHSLEEKEVVTEAMAEVLVKQHELGKARELYHKLSLQNPHKSTYFAAKIEHLKLQ